jgi:predicted RNase H-like HicB family nuclease
MQVFNYTAVIEYDDEAKVYVAHVPALPEVLTEAATLDELDANLREAVELALELKTTHAEPIEPDSFVGTHRVTVTI